MDEKTKIMIEKKVQARIPTAVGEFQLNLYANDIDDKEHLALVLGEVQDKPGVLVRVHSECFTGDVLGSMRCDCGDQLYQAMQMIAEAGEGIIIYLRQEGRGIGLLDKLRSYNLQDQGYDTVEANLALGHQADERDYTIAARILEDQGVRSVKLLTNNPLKIENLINLGIPVIERVPLEPTITADNASYLFTKAQRMNHMYSLEPLELSAFMDGNGNGNGSGRSNRR
jgi:GTP cyclohydrolase II